MEQYFQYELTPFPESLFKNGLMRKPDKSSLRNIFLTDEKNCLSPEDSFYVLDGGALLHRVHWLKGMKFKEVQSYVDYVKRNYGTCFVVFDGYDVSSSVKSNEHERRMNRNGSSPDVIIKVENEVPCSKERFLSNVTNKQQLISLLSE